MPRLQVDENIKTALEGIERVKKAEQLLLCSVGSVQSNIDGNTNVKISNFGF